MGLVGLSGEEFQVESVIHPVVRGLGVPKVWEGFGEGFIPVSTGSDEAAKHVAQGFGMLVTSWDFEAYRHFCEAVKRDPDCLMGYWGIVMSLAGSQHEFFKERQLAVGRMLDLAEAREWTQLEQGYVQAAGRLVTEGAWASGEVFGAISEKFPNDLMSRLFSLFFMRDGFDEFGKANARQAAVTEGLFSELRKAPESLAVMSFWVASQAESPTGGAALRDEVLPVARKLARLHEGFAPFQLVLAHVEARCGNAALAIQAAERAIGLYEKYQKEEGVLFYDCEGWVRAKVYLVNLYESKGEGEKAVALAEELAGMEVVEERVYSRGAGLLLWEGRTAGARILMGRDELRAFEAGQKMLGKLPEEQWFKEKSLTIHYRDCWAIYHGVRLALVSKDLKGAKVVYQTMVERARALDEMKPLAENTSSYGSWMRATNALSVAVTELRGMISEAEEGISRLGALNWYQSACDRQGKPTHLLPPVIDYPMELRLGNFHLTEKRYREAGEAFRRGLELRPNHLGTLKGYQRALAGLGRTEEVEVLQRRIDAVAR